MLHIENNCLHAEWSSLLGRIIIVGRITKREKVITCIDRHFRQFNKEDDIVINEELYIQNNQAVIKKVTFVNRPCLVHGFAASV